MKQPVTRRQAIAATVATAGVFLTACGTRPRKTDQPVQETVPRYRDEAVTVVAAFAGSQAELEMRQAQVDAFKQKFSRITIDFQTISGNRFEWLTTRFAAGTPPDLVYMNEQNQNPIAQGGVLVDLAPYVKTDKELKPELYYRDLWEAGKFEGKLVSIPQEVSPIVVYYNVSLFENATLPAPRDNWTWEDLLVIAQRLTKVGPEGTVWGINRNATWWGGFCPFVFTNGGDLMDKERKRVTFNTPENREAFQFIVDLMHKHKVMPPPGTDPPQNAFQIGTVAMGIAGAWNVTPYNNYARQDPAFRFDVVRFPRKKSQLGIAATLVYGIAQQSKVPGATWELLRFLCLREGQEFVARATFAVPSMNDPRLVELFVTANPMPKNARAFVEQAKELRMDWFVPKFQDMQREWTAALEPMWRGEKSVADALAELDQRINRSILGVS